MYFILPCHAPTCHVGHNFEPNVIVLATGQSASTVPTTCWDLNRVVFYVNDKKKETLLLIRDSYYL